MQVAKSRGEQRTTAWRDVSLARPVRCALAWLLIMVLTVRDADAGPLDPRGRIHVPIGVANTLDTLKTFVEAEGNFSPGVGSYGVYFWIFDHQSGKLTAPTMDGVRVERGLHGRGYLIPWSRWQVGDLAVRTEVCEVKRDSPKGPVFVVGALARLANRTRGPRKLSLYAALRPLGPAGWPVRNLAVSDRGDALLVDGHPAIVATEEPNAAGVLSTDTIGGEALSGRMPQDRTATSGSGDCSGALRFDLEIAGGATTTVGLICPVLPGRRAVGHQWDGKSTWAQLDLAELNPAEGGQLQPDPGLDYYRRLSADQLFAEAEAYWKDLVGRATIRVPDPRWAEAMAAITGHVAMSMNHGAADVAVVNYNVFNRDGVYVANILQKSGQFDLAAEAIDYFLSRPFNGRVYPEADNPGQILWVMGEHWLFTRDREWLKRVYRAAEKLAALIRYSRTTKGPHWVSLRSLDFGDTLPPEERKELKPGRCDGHHPEYTEAFDVAGMGAAVLLAEAAGNDRDAVAWRQLADRLFEQYDRQFGERLSRGYGSYSVLWPCRLYPISHDKAYEQFKNVGVRKPGDWRYFPLATAHQGVLTGNREAGHATLGAHLAHEQMHGWYAFDEGGRSGCGGWRRVRTTWNSSVAMPHGWAVAEFWLLLRDCLVHEDGRRLVLLAGVPQEWLAGTEQVSVDRLPTHFGPCSFTYAPSDEGATLRLTGGAAPPEGYVLRLPPAVAATVTVDGKQTARRPNGEVPLPAGMKEARIHVVGK